MPRICDGPIQPTSPSAMPQSKGPPRSAQTTVAANNHQATGGITPCTAVNAIAGLPGAQTDRENTVLVGHSAGGHLALWAAGRDRVGRHRDRRDHRSDLVPRTTEIEDVDRAGVAPPDVVVAGRADGDG